MITETKKNSEETELADNYSFEFVSHYRQDLDYLATERKTRQKTRIGVQYRNPEFDPMQTSLTAEEFEREVWQQTGIVRWCGNSREPIPQQMFAEFVSYWERRGYDFKITLSRGYYDIEGQEWIKLTD
jgi:hypothetical protein